MRINFRVNFGVKFFSLPFLLLNTKNLCSMLETQIKIKSKTKAKTREKKIVKIVKNLWIKGLLSLSLLSLLAGPQMLFADPANPSNPVANNPAPGKFNPHELHKIRFIPMATAPGVAIFVRNSLSNSDPHGPWVRLSNDGRHPNVLMGNSTESDFFIQIQASHETNFHCFVAQSSGYLNNKGEAWVQLSTGNMMNGFVLSQQYKNNWVNFNTIHQDRPYCESV